VNLKSWPRVLLPAPLVMAVSELTRSWRIPHCGNDPQADEPVSPSASWKVANQLCCQAPGPRMPCCTRRVGPAAGNRAASLSGQEVSLPGAAGGAGPTATSNGACDAIAKKMADQSLHPKKQTTNKGGRAIRPKPRHLWLNPWRDRHRQGADRARLSTLRISPRRNGPFRRSASQLTAGGPSQPRNNLPGRGSEDVCSAHAKDRGDVFTGAAVQEPRPAGSQADATAETPSVSLRRA